MPETPKQLEKEKLPKDLSEEQVRVLRDVYGYQDKAEYTPEDLEMARKMFDKPEKFALLRKILQVLTPDERGLTMANSQAFIDASPADHAKYAFESAVAVRADEHVRQMLVQFYRVLRGNVQDVMKADFEKENQKKFDEGKRTAEFEEQQESEKRTLGTNL